MLYNIVYRYHFKKINKFIYSVYFTCFTGLANPELIKMIIVKNPITGGNPNDDIKPMNILLDLRDLLQAVDGNISTHYLWNFIQEKAKENVEAK